jgi:hypothetical protein
VAGLVVGLV